MQMNPEQWEQERKQFEDGTPIPPVNTSDVRQMWEAARRIASMPSRPNVAVGLGVYAALGVEAASSRPEQFHAIWLRETMLAALVARGALKDYMDGDRLNEKVFAAATIPCDQDDIAEAFLQLKLSQSPAAIVAAAKEEWRAKGYDADKPKIDGKFLDWLRNNC